MYTLQCKMCTIGVTFTVFKRNEAQHSRALCTGWTDRWIWRPARVWRPARASRRWRQRGVRGARAHWTRGRCSTCWSTPHSRRAARSPTGRPRARPPSASWVARTCVATVRTRARARVRACTRTLYKYTVELFIAWIVLLWSGLVLVRFRWAEHTSNSSPNSVTSWRTNGAAAGSPHRCSSSQQRPSSARVQAHPRCWSRIICTSSMMPTLTAHPHHIHITDHRVEHSKHYCNSTRVARTFLTRRRHFDSAREVLGDRAGRVRAPPLLAGHQVARRALRSHIRMSLLYSTV